MEDILRKLKIEIVPISKPRPYRQNARKHSRRQIDKIAASMRAFGWVVPIVVDAKNTIVTGHARFEAAKQLGLKHVPVISVHDMSDAQVRAYRLADNRTAEDADWDSDLLRIELAELYEIETDFEITATGFEIGEIDLFLGDATDREDEVADSDLADPAVSQIGDLWLLGKHRLLCGDALVPENYRRLMDGERAEIAVTDPPYNVRIGGNVSGRRERGEFVMASGEMSTSAFEVFLKTSLSNIASVSKPGALVFVFMDWRHLSEALAAGCEAFDELKNLCVWVKGNGGMGSLYRSQHELVLVFKRGKAPHINNIALGAHGRNRTNVWHYPGVNSFGAGREEALASHPTVKPVAMIADAILDASKRGGIVLDP
ncbi:MAG: ParB N-terminal domain-containing protein, partial [Rhizobiaceae bacterium]|nr:ParB N-terminal domain-containing protein [Rhizobiaceae bacterium]